MKQFVIRVCLDNLILWLRADISDITAYLNLKGETQYKTCVYFKQQT